MVEVIRKTLGRIVDKLTPSSSQSGLSRNEVSEDRQEIARDLDTSHPYGADRE